MEERNTITLTKIVFKDNQASQWICDSCMEMLYEFFSRSEVKVDGDTREAYSCGNCGREPGDN
jgi:methionyl-tRNA synthetase